MPPEKPPERQAYNAASVAFHRLFTLRQKDMLTFVPVTVHGKRPSRRRREARDRRGSVRQHVLPAQVVQV